MTLMPSASTPATPDVAAKALASLGWRVIPIGPGDKFPRGLERWQEAATDDVDVIDGWWSGRFAGHGVGVATGEGSGIWVLDIDVADGKPGQESYQALVDEHGHLPETVVTITGTGGRHVYFQWDPERPITAGMATRLGPGLDIRGTGGQVLAPPTIHPNGQPYAWDRNRDPWATPVAEAPDWLYDVLLPPAATPAEPARIVLADGPQIQPGDVESIADHIRQTYDWETELTKAGWTPAQRSDAAGDTYWVRPGKDPRLGHSACLHGSDGPLVIWTTEIPPSLAAAGTRTADGGGVSVTILDFLAGTYYAGDKSALCSAERAKITPAPTSIASSTSGPPAPAIQLETNLPADWWETRELLEHIRDAAWSRLLSPDAVLVAILARCAAATPPAFRLPAITGAESSVSLYGVLSGPPGTGKSSAVGTASKLFPFTDPRVVEAGQLGSGEGLIEVYLDLEEVDDGAGGTKKVKTQTKSGAFVTLDEGTALTEMGMQRRGTTILSVLRSMWTGGTVGQANAAAETRRKLEAGRYNLGFLMGLQPNKAGDLLADDAAGTPQRFVWCSSVDPNIPDTPVVFPGPLTWRAPSLGGSKTSSDLTIADPIRAEIRGAALGRARGEILVEALDAHGDLVRLKTAALLAILEGRLEVTVDDWELATEAARISRNVRSLAVESVRAAQVEAAQARDSAALQRSLFVQEGTDRAAADKYQRTLESMCRSVWRVVEAAGAEGATRNTARNATNSRQRKVVAFVDVLTELQRLLWITPHPSLDGRWVAGTARPAES